MATAEAAHARLLHDRSREHLGLPRDIAAHHHHRTDLADDRAERGHHRGQERDPDLPQLQQEALPTTGAERRDLLPQAGIQLLQRRQRQARDDRKGDHELGDDHRPARVQQPKGAQWSISRQEQHHEQPDDDGRSRHAGIDDGDHETPSAELVERDDAAERHPHHDGDDQSHARDPERPQDDLVDLRVTSEEQTQRLDNPSQMTCTSPRRASSSCRGCLRTDGTRALRTAPRRSCRSSPDHPPRPARRRTARRRPR